MISPKTHAASAALGYLVEETYIGIGTGSTVNELIKLLEPWRNKVAGFVSSSLATTKLLKQRKFDVFDLNAVAEISVYIDGADEVAEDLSLIKGGGGALLREKIVASMAKQFICIADASKQVDELGSFPLPVEVLPMARSLIARRSVSELQAEPVYRDGFITDNGNHILDLHGLRIHDAKTLEAMLNMWPGVICNGIFSQRKPDICLIAKGNEIVHLGR